MCVRNSGWTTVKHTKMSTGSKCWRKAMAPIIKPGEGLLYMKVGTHAQETLEEIIERKRKEIEDAGFALWGYGGNTCHPVSMVQPFARNYEQKAGVIYLCMQPMTSKHFALPIRASEFSRDGFTWEKI